MPAAIRAFFESYRDAFNRLDGRAVTAHYALPAMISNQHNAGLFVDVETLIKNNESLCHHYAQGGFARADFCENVSLEQGGDFFLADLRWTIQFTDQPAQQFNTTYLLAKRIDDGDEHSRWKIEHVTAYSERQFWNEETK